MKFVHLEIIAPPRNRLARSLHANAGQRADGPAGTMIPRNPLGKDQRHLAFVGGNLQVRVIDVSRSIGQIDVQPNRLRRETGRQEDTTQKSKNQKTQASRSQPNLPNKAKSEGYRKRRASTSGEVEQRR